MTASNTDIRPHWRDYVLSPKGALVFPVRAALVPWDPEKIAEADIHWREVNGEEELPNEPGMGLLLDFGVKTTGFLYFESAGSMDFGIDIQSGPDLRLVLFEDIVKYSSGAGCYRDDKFRAFRFLKMRCTGGSGIKVRTMVEFTGWPGDYEGYFYSSDDQLNRIWYTGAYTIQICTQPHELSGCYNNMLPRMYGDFPRHWRSPHGRYCIWDAPRRDREVWIGDMWPESQGLLHSFHAPEAIKTSLLAVAQRQRENGLIPGSGITLQTFSEYSCWWIVLLDYLYMMTNDREFIHEMKPHVQRAVDWLLNELEDFDGFLRINHRQTWAWTLMRRGAVTGSQAVAVAALEGGARILAFLGDSDRAGRATKGATNLRQLITTKLWNGKDGVFRDCLLPPDGVERVSCDSNSLVPLFGISSEEQTTACLEYLRRNLWTPFGTKTIVPPEPEANNNWAHNHNIWPFVVGLELEARFVRGHRETAMELLRQCWGNMIAHDTSCFWEMVDGETGDFVTHRRISDLQGPSWDTWDSYGHGWSAAPTSLMQSHLLGIRPTAPGFSHFQVKPWLADLDFAEGAVPTPHGPIRARIERGKSGKTHLQLEVPAGTRATVAKSDGSTIDINEGSHQLDS
ncbi:MAG: hypothetical protein JJU11_18280 [Candidatus Sumerlaeia bacterium]|nr:hypothetical protein [Candidatus Sumerlaeia bacterium]